MNAITVNDIKKAYGSVEAVKGISFEVKKGEIFGIVGPNGAGKTTTIEMMEGMRVPDSGTIELLGLNPVKQARDMKQRIGIQLQATSIHEKIKVKEALELFASFYKKKTDLSKLISFLSLEELLPRYVKTLSGGQKQRVTLALALVNEPDVLFLDEPSMGLDPGARSTMWQLIGELKNQGKTIVMTTHYMEEAEKLCDRVAIINKGQLLALATPKELVQQMGGKTRVVFSKPLNISIDALQSLSGVVDMEISDEISLVTTHVDGTISALYSLATSEGWSVQGLRVENGSLDDVFIKLSNGGLTA